MTLMKNRENLYRLLGRIYKKEIDIQFIEALKNMNFPVDSSEGELKEGYLMLTEYLKEVDTNYLEDLDVDYAKVFLGAGISEGTAAFPYESVYTSRKKSMMQEARDQVMNIYLSKGLIKIGENSKISEDHIALELEYMAYLCNQNDLKEQNSFLREHLLNWVSKFCEDIDKYSNTDFYKAIAKITNGFLKLDSKILESMEGN